MARMTSDERRLTRADLRELDRQAVEELGIPSCVLMENAGRGAAEHVLAFARDMQLELPTERARDLRIAVFCGPGNNGGDGGVVARHLANAGVRVDVLCTESTDALRGDALLQRRIVERMRLPVHDVSTVEGLASARGVIDEADVLVDGLLGTGFEGVVRPKIARVIEAIVAARTAARTRARARVVALDLPSGLDCDRGEPAQPCVVADLTVTFAAQKVGFDQDSARQVLGRVEVVSIGAPLALLDRARLDVSLERSPRR
jgi:NAD(P)H-hydrate epimerase